MPSTTRPHRSNPVSSPPRAVAPMKAPMKAGGNKNALNREVGGDGLRDWSYGLLDCFAARRLCCWATFCPCVVYGQNRQRLRHLHRHNAPLAGGGDTFSQDCRIYCCMAVPCFYWVFQEGRELELEEKSFSSS